MIILITGGSGSGKSSYAEKRTMEFENAEKYYLATMQVYGEEGQRKVLRHKKLRAGKGFETIEQTKDILKVCDRIKSKNSVVLLECMSNLIANEMFLEDGSQVPEEKVTEKVISEVLELSRETNLVIVTNEVFSDGIAYEEGTLSYMRALGKVNSALAAASQEVVEVVVGIPVLRKRIS